MKTIGLFGGTFNPVHWGHVRTAIEIKKFLELDKMLLVPCATPPHRELPNVSAELRLAMLKAAIVDFPELGVDDRELRRTGPSYTVDTLQSLHDEMPNQSLVLCVGVDAFLKLDTWHRWRDILDLAHIVVAHRPGWSLEAMLKHIPAILKTEIEKRLVQRVDHMRKQTAGMILELNVTQIDISSSTIRKRVAGNESITALVPAGVAVTIQKYNLYRESEGNK